MDKIIKAGPISGVRSLSYRRSNKDSRRGVYSVSGDAADTVEVYQHEDEDAQETSLSAEPSLRDLADLYRSNEDLKLRLADAEKENSSLMEALTAYESRDKASLESAAKEGFDKGYEDGRSAGFQEAQSEANAAISQFQVVLENISNKSDEGWLQLQSLSADLAFAVVCKLLGDHSLAEDVVKGSVTQVLTDVRQGSRIRLHVHAKDYRLLQELVCQEEIFRDRAIELVVDDHVELGGCLIETDFGAWDGRFESQLRLLKNAIDQSLR